MRLCKGLVDLFRTLSSCSLTSWRINRVFIGAALSTADLITDIIITYTFWKDGKEIFYKSSIAMLGTSMLLTLLIVCLQNRKLGIKRVLHEMIPVVVGLKPALDAYRVASGTNQEEGQPFTPIGEMVSEFVISRRRSI